MLYSTLLRSALLGLASAASIPNNDGFPNPNKDQMKAIANKAGGLLPDGPLPKDLPAATTLAFQLINANELFETAYFSSLLKNVTDEVDGYKSNNKAELMKIFSTILAVSSLTAKSLEMFDLLTHVQQEEQHAIAATAILTSAGKFAPGACQYQFPVTNLKDAISLAETFTAIVLGALQGANVLFAKDGSLVPIQVVSSVIGQEGEQNGYYRVFAKQVPSESPFLTYVPAPYAWSALQMFIVKGSCPFALDKVALPILPALMTNGGAVAAIKPMDQDLSFSADVSSMMQKGASQYYNTDGKGLFITYGTGQQMPISVPIKDVKWCGGKMEFKANFPYSEHVMSGFSHAALTMGEGFNSSDAAAEKALAGPGVIQVSNSIDA